MLKASKRKRRPIRVDKTEQPKQYEYKGSINSTMPMTRLCYEKSTTMDDSSS